MALPLPLRNRLAELILDAFEDAFARETLDALAAFCREPAGRLDRLVLRRLDTLGWFEARANGLVVLRAAHARHASDLCRRAGAGARVFLRPVPAGGTVAAMLERAARLADEGLYFEVHELLEPVWFQAEGELRDALQGLIQVAVGFHHLDSGNRVGAASLLAEGLEKVRRSRAALPVETRDWRRALASVLAGLRAGAVPAVRPPWPRGSR